MLGKVVTIPPWVKFGRVSSVNKNIVVLTGAGISAESGIDTFRGPGGLWEGQRVEDVATPEGFARDPELVQDFYNQRRRALQSDAIAPNAAHKALWELEQACEGEFLLVTQNVDDLHERAGSQALIHMHGELLKKRCSVCHSISTERNDITLKAVCENCVAVGSLRPHVVWFGEMPLQMEQIDTALSRCDLFIAIGTSGNVYPAAGFVEQANRAGAHSVEINLDRSSVHSNFAENLQGKASIVLPKYVRHLGES